MYKYIWNYSLKNVWTDGKKKKASDWSLLQTQSLDKEYVILKWMTTFILCLTYIRNYSLQTFGPMERSKWLSTVTNPAFGSTVCNSKMNDDFYSMPDINPKNILRSQKDKQNVVFVDLIKGTCSGESLTKEAAPAVQLE